MTYRRGQPASRRGIAMLLVLVAVAMASVLGMAFMGSQSTSIGIAQNLERKAHARAIAESGLASALYIVQNDSSWRSTYSSGAWASDQPFADGTFTIGGEDEDGDLDDDSTDSVTLWSTGTYEGVTHTVRATVEPGSVTVLRVLLMVADADNLTAAEAQRKSLLEDFSFQVTPISQGISSGDLATEAAAADVLYVVDTCSAATIGSKLSNLDIGVVNELAALDNELGLCSSDGQSYTSSSIDVVDNLHYITAEFDEASGSSSSSRRGRGWGRGRGRGRGTRFTTGSLTITSSTQSLRRAGGSAPSGATTLAQRPGDSKATLVALDAGQTAYGGSPAPGRRVMLPWSGTGFDITKLNSNGQTLMQRAVEWAAQPVPPGLEVAHWGFDETSGSVAYDNSGAHHGVYAAGATLDQDGAVDAAAAFDGVNDGAVVAHDQALNLTSQISVAAWVRASAWSSGAFILQKGDGGSQYRLYAQGGNLVWDLADVEQLSAALPSTGQWVHVTATYNGEAMAIYYNGQLAASCAASGSIATSDDDLKLGKFQGRLDDLRLYDHGLAAAQARYLYEYGVPAYDIDSPPQLIALYHFREFEEEPTLVGHWALDEAGSILTGGVAVSGGIDMRDNARIDSYQSSLGAYGGANLGTDAIVSTNSTTNNAVMLKTSARISGSVYVGPGGDPSKVIKLLNSATITGSKSTLASDESFSAGTAPSPSTSLGAVTYSTDTTLSSDFRCTSLTISSNATVTISGNISILCTGDVTLKDNAKLVVSSGNSLLLYVQGDVELKDNAKLNMTSNDPSLVVLATDSGSEVSMQGNALATMAIVSPDGELTLDGNAELYGSYRGGSLEMKSSGKLHQDLDAGGGGGSGSDTVANSVDDNNGTYDDHVTRGVSGQVDSAAQFDGDGFVTIPHIEHYLLERGAVAFWFKTADRTKTQGLFSKDAAGFGNGGHLAIWIESNVVQARLSSTNANYDLQSSTLSNNTWYHLVLAFGPGGLRLYINGNLVDSDDYCGGLGRTSGGAGNREPIILGARAAESVTGTGAPLSDYLDGALDDVRILRGTITARHADDLYDGDTPDDDVSYVVRDSSGFGEPVDLYIEDDDDVSWLDDGGLQITHNTSIISPAPAAKIHNALTETNQLTMELICAPTNVTQSGRLVSDSSGSSLRNLSLSQSLTSYNVQLRSGGSTNGDPSVSNTDGALEASTLEHIVVVYDGQTLSLYRNGVLEASSSRAGSLSSWSDLYHFMVASESNGDNPWRGKMYRLALYDRALNSTQIDNLFRGLSPSQIESSTSAITVTWAENQ